MGSVLTLIVDAGVQELPVLPFHRILKSGPVTPPGNGSAIFRRSFPTQR